MSSYAATCAVDPGPDTACPSGSLTWQDTSNFSAFPELSQSDIESLIGAVLVLFAVAVGIRFIIKQFVK